MDAEINAARALLADTAELPATRRGLLNVLSQYRHTLHDLLAAAERLEHDREQPGNDP